MHAEGKVVKMDRQNDETQKREWGETVFLNVGNEKGKDKILDKYIRDTDESELHKYRAQALDAVAEG